MGNPKRRYGSDTWSCSFSSTWRSITANDGAGVVVAVVSVKRVRMRAAVHFSLERLSQIITLESLGDRVTAWNTMPSRQILVQNDMATRGTWSGRLEFTNIIDTHWRNCVCQGTPWQVVRALCPPSPAFLPLLSGEGELEFPKIDQRPGCHSSASHGYLNEKSVGMQTRVCPRHLEFGFQGDMLQGWKPYRHLS